MLTNLTVNILSAAELPVTGQRLSESSQSKLEEITDDHSGENIRSVSSNVLTPQLQNTWRHFDRMSNICSSELLCGVVRVRSGSLSHGTLRR